MNFLEKNCDELLAEYRSANSVSAYSEVKKRIIEYLRINFDNCFLGAEGKLRELLLVVFSDLEIFRVYDEMSEIITLDAFLGFFQEAPEFIQRNYAEFVKRGFDLDYLLNEADSAICSIDDSKTLLEMGVEPYQVFIAGKNQYMERELSDPNTMRNYIDLMLSYSLTADDIKPYLLSILSDECIADIKLHPENLILFTDDV